MERITITNDNDVEAFVKAQDQSRQYGCAVFMASRSALRAVPLNSQSVIAWRLTLIAAVASAMPTAGLKDAAYNAIQQVISTNSDHEAFPAYCAVNTVFMENAAAFNAAMTVNSAFGAYDDFEMWETQIGNWSEVEVDAELWLDEADQKIGSLKQDFVLWNYENLLKKAWAEQRKLLIYGNLPESDWSFWIKWYDDILAGNPQNWDMLHEIATTPDIDWEAPSREVNDKINGIVEAYALKNSYYFERIEFSEAKQKLIVVPEGSFDRASVQMAYQRLRDAIEDVREAPKEGNLDPEYALRDEIRILERTLDRPTTQPIFVVEKCFDCVKRIQARLDDATIFGHDVEDFQKALTRSALDIFGADEDARRIVERRTNENLLSLAKEDRDRLSHFVEEAAPIIGEDLKADLETDLSGDADPQTEGEGSTLRGVSRLLRIGILVRENKDNIAFNATLISAAITVIQLIFGLF